MVAAALILVVIVVVGTIALAWALRGWVSEESRLEAHLHDAGTHTLTYAVPNGVDPVVVKVAVTRAGFSSAIESAGTREAVRVECAEGRRALLRTVIEDLHLPEDAGSGPSGRRVVFEDER